MAHIFYVFLGSNILFFIFEGGREEERLQIDRKQSCQTPPTFGTARNNSGRNKAAFKRFPATSLQLSRQALLCSTVLPLAVNR